MKLYIKQKVFSWTDKFFVKDENGQDRFYVEGEFFSFGRKLHVYDMNRQEVAYIEQQLMHWMPHYHVYIGDMLKAEIVQKFTWFHPTYLINGPEWTVEGSFWEHEYTVSDRDGSTIVDISKELMSWGDSYELDVAEADNELLALAVVLTIDCVKASRNN